MKKTLFKGFLLALVAACGAGIASAEPTYVTDSLYFSPVEGEVNAGDTVELTLNLYNQTGYAAFQADFHYGEGIKAVQYREWDDALGDSVIVWGKTINRAKNHQLAGNDPAGTSLRIVVFNMQNALIKAKTEGDLSIIKLLIAIDPNLPTGEYVLKIDRQKFSTGVPADHGVNDGWHGGSEEGYTSYVLKVKGKPTFDWNKVELMSYGIPSSGRVGEPIHATASVKNGNDKAIAANTYTAKLHIYDAEMQEDATAEATEIAANSTNGYSFDWTPQAAGTYYAYVQFGFGENAEYRLIQSVPEQIVVKTAPSGVNDVNAGKTVESIRYYNAMGVESAAPFEGLNIVVTNYTDGSKATSKVVK